MANTTSPADDQIHGFMDWSTPEICTVYTTTMYSEMPCPTHLFLDIIRINRLRTQATAGVSYKDVIYSHARDIFASIESFSPENWTEPYSVPEKPEMTLVANIFKTAVALYGILSLPPPPPPPPPRSRSLPPPTSTTGVSVPVVSDGAWPQHPKPPTMLSCEKSRLAFRQKLMREVCEATENKAIKIYLAWPLAVLGAALFDGSASDRTTVEQCLLKIRVPPQTYCGPTTSLTKLRAFWTSGKRGWEDCFDEPCSVLA